MDVDPAEPKPCLGGLHSWWNLRRELVRLIGNREVGTGRLRRQTATCQYLSTPKKINGGCLSKQVVLDVNRVSRRLPSGHQNDPAAIQLNAPFGAHRGRYWFG